MGRCCGRSTGTRSTALFNSDRRPRGVGGADHSLRGGTGDHSTLDGGGEDHSPRVGCGPWDPFPCEAILREGRKLERDGLSVRKLSEASSDLK